jgi:osmotically-inducible protein OsmY
VDSQETKDTAEHLARSVPGVVDVTNELAIDQDKGAAEQRVDMRPQAWENMGRRL